MKYVVVFEKGENNYGAYVPDLPGCGVVGGTLQEVRKLIAEAIDFHIEGLQESGYDIPQPSFTLPVQDQPGTSSELITVQIPGKSEMLTDIRAHFHKPNMTET